MTEPGLVLVLRAPNLFFEERGPLAQTFVPVKDSVTGQRHSVFGAISINVRIHIAALSKL